MRRFIQKLGPGLLFAGAAIGVSHLVQSTRAGADFSFGLIWALLLAIVLTAIGTLGGFENFLLAVVLGGAIQFLFGILRAGVIGYYFPSSRKETVTPTLPLSDQL